MGSKMYFIQEGIVDIVLKNGEVSQSYEVKLYRIWSLNLKFCWSPKLILSMDQNIVAITHLTIDKDTLPITNRLMG